MIQKDLAEKYITKARENAISFKDDNFPNIPLYQESLRIMTILELQKMIETTKY